MEIVGKYIFAIPGVRPMVQRAASAYRASVTAELRRYGLRYDDLLNEHDEDVKQALAKLPPQELENRHKRLKRAIDLDVKKTYLPEHIQQQVDVWNPYLSDRIETIKKQRYERQIYD